MKTTMTNQEAKAEFNKVLAKMTAAGVDPIAIARLEVVREYLTNDAFRQWLQDYSFAATN